MTLLHPSKHAWPDDTVMAAATRTLRLLRQRQSVPYSELLEAATRNSRGGEFLFAPAINLLYLLGLLEYHPKGDSFEYVGRS